LKYWLPPLVWMAAIFTGSSDAKSSQHSSRFVEPILHWLFPHMTQPHIEQIHYDFRKFCHLTEYAILALLLWRAIRQDVRKQIRRAGTQRRRMELGRSRTRSLHCLSLRRQRRNPPGLRSQPDGADFGCVD
jgi:hypothetical protein